LLIPETDDNGTIETVLSVAHDITEIRRSAQILEDANRRKDEFLAMLAHELRNPLAPIRNASEILARKLADDPQMKKTVSLVKRQVTHLARLVDDLLDVSRITRGKINVIRESVELATVIARAVETVEPMLSRQRHELVVNVAPEPLYIDGDLTRLTQIVGNILSNAIKYTDAGGRIETTARAIGEQIEIRIRDNGIGIDPAMLPDVFDLFTQSSQLNGRGQTGLGIGLALAKRLVEMHGGEVQAHSAGPGQGSEFIVLLPRQAGAAAAAARVNSVTPAPLTATMARRILVADDNRDALESLARLLELSGHEIHKAVDGVQALEAATRERPDLVLLDIGMPGMDGYEVARRIRAQPWGREATLIALTGWGQDTDRTRSREAGFDSHCVKPLDLQYLFTLLDSLPAARDAGGAPVARTSSTAGTGTLSNRNPR
jgi:CheY-like chemotaxis protein